MAWPPIFDDGTLTMTYSQDTEKEELLTMLAGQRFFLRFTAQNLTDEQAASHPTVSELSLGGLIKHVSATEKQWARFIVQGQAAFAPDEQTPAESDSAFAEKSWANAFTMTDGETLASIIAEYDQVAERTETIVRETLDLNAGHELPEAPWFQPGTSWSVRRVILHLIGETSQHAGHADILRETIDGQKTMG